MNNLFWTEEELIAILKSLKAVAWADDILHSEELTYMMEFCNEHQLNTTKEELKEKHQSIKSRLTIIESFAILRNMQPLYKMIYLRDALQGLAECDGEAHPEELKLIANVLSHIGLIYDENENQLTFSELS